MKFEGTLKKHNRKIMKAYENANLMEVRYKLTEPCANNNPECEIVESWWTIPGEGITVSLTSKESQRMKMTKMDGWFVGDEVISVEQPITLKKALNILNRSDIVKPTTNIGVLRNPLYGADEDTYFIFGSHNTSFVAVNTRTKGVSEFS